MSQFDYLVPLISIMVGLALADLAASFHRMMRAHQRVRWHWFPLSAAVILILLTLEIWWSIRYLGATGLPLTIGLFLPFMAQLILLFLCASAALPDEVPAAGLDLRSYYFENRGYFWSLLALLMVCHLLIRLFLAWATGGQEAVWEALAGTIPNLILIAILASLATTSRAWWHGVWLLLMPPLYLLSIAGRELTY